MLKRKIYNQMLAWSREKSKECLLVKGARQVGKTTTVRELGKREYGSFIEINFLQHPDYREIFRGSLAAEDILKRISAVIPGVTMIPHKTLIFLDEIQKCAAARTALKFFAEDNRYDVIASGSLLGLHYGADADPDVTEVESVPVGFERSMIMYSMDFEEFLWALGYDSDAIATLREYFDERRTVPAILNDKYEALLREYIVVGGMPEVVNDFAEHQDFSRVQQAQEKIIESYDDDISNHAKGAEKVKVRACYSTIPSQLARENKKFKYSQVEKKATARKFGDSIEWLRDSNMVHVCNNVYEPYLPLAANIKENEFKLYMNDSGLLMALYGMQTKLAVLNNTIKGNAKGGIYENVVSDILTKLGYRLCYYKKSDSTQEIEFLIEKDGEVVPVEVKAGNRASESLNNFIQTYDPAAAIKLIDGNIGTSGDKLTLPHYMAMFL